MNINELDTPCVVINETIVESNIQRFQNYCDAHQLQLRPHIKTHKLPAMAFQQLQAGAVGINCQKVSEAEVFADAGIKDILITFNILGEKKLARLLALAKRANITAVTDNSETLNQISQTFAQAGMTLALLVECDTGAQRCGVQSPEAALALAQQIDAAPGTTFSGLLTYPHPTKTFAANTWLTQAKKLCEQANLAPNIISTGGTPNMWNAEQFSVATEYRVGTYIYNDRSLAEQNSCEISDCALSVLTTVVSCPTPDRVVIDAGSKALSSDLLGLQGYGWVKEYPQALIYSLSEEHGCIDFSACSQRPAIGDKLNIIPNHACVVSNLFDTVHLEKNGIINKTLAVDARGKVY